MFKGVWRVGGILAVSRAFGDGALKRKNWVVATPEISVIDLETENVDYFLVATDGLWDVFSSQEAVKFFESQNFGSERKDQRTAVRNLVEEALQKGSSDNICVMLVQHNLIKH